MLVAVTAVLALAGTAAAALVPGVYDPGNTGCPVATYANGVLHLAKNCATSTNAAAGADITGLSGPFVSASFTLASASQCQGGSPRFDIVTTTGTFFLGCNNVTPTTNANGTVTYTFNAATIAAGGNQVPFPTGTITSADVLVDVQGVADLTQISVNGVSQVPTPTTGGGGGNGGGHDTSKCKHGGWKTMTSPKFKNQGQCVSYFAHQKHKLTHGKDHEGKGKKH
jgi:hypothetical protein